jgi:hypothetical protein
MHLSRSGWVFSDFGHRWFETSSRSARLQGLLEVDLATYLAAVLGDLGVSTLCSIKTMTQFSSLSGASNQPCCLLQCSGTTLRVRLRRPLIFLVVPTCWETRFTSRCYSACFFFTFLLLDHHSGHPARHDARILLYECIFDALWIFSSSFRSIGSLLHIGRHCHTVSFPISGCE